MNAPGKFKMSPEAARQYSRSRLGFLRGGPIFGLTALACYATRSHLAVSLAILAVGMVLILISIAFTARAMQQAWRRIQAEKQAWIDAQPQPPWPPTL